MESAEPNKIEEGSNHELVKEAGYSQSNAKEIPYSIKPELSDEILKEIAIARESKKRGDSFSLEEVKTIKALK